jgi:hypothetical protein
MKTIKLQRWLRPDHLPSAARAKLLHDLNSDAARRELKFAAFRDIQGILDSLKIFVPGLPRVLLLAEPLRNHTSGNPA